MNSDMENTEDLDFFPFTTNELQSNLLAPSDQQSLTFTSSDQQSPKFTPLEQLSSPLNPSDEQSFPFTDSDPLQTTSPVAQICNYPPPMRDYFEQLGSFHALICRNRISSAIAHSAAQTNMTLRSIIPAQPEAASTDSLESTSPSHTSITSSQYPSAYLNPDHGVFARHNQPHPVEREPPTDFRHVKALLDLDELDGDNADTQTFFDSEQDAADWQASLGENNEPDETAPTTDEEKRACVRLLFKAFKSTAVAQDNYKMVEPFHKSKHDNRKVEVMCWSLLMAIESRQTYGPLLKRYFPDKSTQTPHINSFADRFAIIIDVMLHEKTICKHLLDAPYMNTFVDDPKKSSVRVRSNRNLNKRKGDIMKVGKEVIKSNSSLTNPTPSKRKRTTQIEWENDEDSVTYVDDDSSYDPTPDVRSNAKGNSRKTRSTGKGKTCPQRCQASTAVSKHAPNMKQECPFLLSPPRQPVQTPQNHALYRLHDSANFSVGHPTSVQPLPSGFVGVPQYDSVLSNGIASSIEQGLRPLIDSSSQLNRDYFGSTTGHFNTSSTRFQSDPRAMYEQLHSQYGLGQADQAGFGLNELAIAKPVHSSHLSNHPRHNLPQIGQQNAMRRPVRLNGSSIDYEQDETVDRNVQQ